MKIAIFVVVKFFDYGSEGCSQPEFKGVYFNFDDAEYVLIRDIGGPRKTFEEDKEEYEYKLKYPCENIIYKIYKS